MITKSIIIKLFIIKKSEEGWWSAHMVEHLPSKCKAPSSIPSTEKRGNILKRKPEARLTK
jgi:hypothetical protein